MKPNVLFDPSFDYDGMQIDKQSMGLAIEYIDMGFSWDTTTEGNMWSNIKDILGWFRDGHVRDMGTFDKYITAYFGGDFEKRFMAKMKLPIVRHVVVHHNEGLLAVDHLLNSFNWNYAAPHEKFWETIYLRLLGYYCYSRTPVMHDRMVHGPVIISDELQQMALDYEATAVFAHPLYKKRNKQRTAGRLI